MSIIKKREEKELLTESQIQEICEAIPINTSLPKMVRLSTISRIRTKLYNDLCNVKIYPSLFPSYKKEIVRYYYKTLVASGEAVGVQVAQSIGERQTQNTLNSIDWNDKVLLYDNKKCIVGPVGSYIDTMLENNKEKIEYIPENRTEYLDTSSYDIKMPSVDENGKTEWLKVEAITKHLPVGSLVKVKTKYGREVTATQSKSFLVWDSDLQKFVDKNGSDVRVGDYLPTTCKLEQVDQKLFLNMEDFFSKKEYLYTTELNKAKRLRSENPHSWWKDHQGKDFILPYHRPDSVFLRKENLSLDDGFIYLYKSSKYVSKVPDQIPLDNDFGFLIGIYLAEGWTTKTFTGISNNCPIIRKRVTDWCDRYGITYHLVVSQGKNVRKESMSSDLKIHSVLITRILNLMCNTGSSKKNVPSIAYISNSEFQKGIIDGYFSGDGTVDKKDGSIIASSASLQLIEGINFLLYYFNVIGRVSSMQLNSNNVGSKTIKKTHVIRISNGFAQNFAHQINLTEPNKQNRLETLTLTKKYRRFRGRNQENFPQDRDIVFDQIISIDYDEPSKEYVYDFTVEKTRNFLLFNGLGVRDTFHSSGLSIKTVVVGVPRFSELLNATKSPKMVNCLLYLNEEFNDVSEVRQHAGNMFTDMTMKRLTKRTELIKDEPLEEWHHLYCSIFGVNPGVLGWRLRFYINIDVLYEYQVTMKMIASAIMTEYADAIVLYTPEWDGIVDVFVDEACFSNLSTTLAENNIENIVEEEDEENEEEEEDEKDEIDDIEHLLANPENEEDEKEEKNEKNEKNEYSTYSTHSTYTNMSDEKDEVPSDIYRVIHMEDKILPALMSIRVCGIEGIKDIFFEKRKDEWLITTEGSNLYRLFCNPLIDKTRSMSNDMWEICNVFGIEAARQFLIEEYMDIVSSDGTFVNSSNVELLVDIMVYTGTIISISRYGQKKVGCGPMAKASFEESLENFLKAGLNGEKESANGVSASIMLGKMPNIGTGVFDLLVDINKLIQSGVSGANTTNTNTNTNAMKEIKKTEEKIEKFENKKENSSAFVKNVMF